MSEMVSNIWISVSDVGQSIGKSFFESNRNIPLLFKLIKVILGIAYWIVYGICWLISAIVMIVLFLAVYLIECFLQLLGGAVRFYYPKFNSNYFYNAMVAVLFLPPVYSSNEILIIGFQQLGSFCEYLLVGFFSIVSKKRRKQIDILMTLKEQEKRESKKIKKALKKQAKEVNKMERKSIPKIPIILDNKQIRKDISYLETLPDKSSLIKYIEGVRDRFIAKGQAKTYKEIEKVVSAKTQLEKALEELAFAEEGRYTAQERAQAKYLLETLQAQDAIRKHNYGVKKDQDLRDLRFEVEQKNLEADLAEATKREISANKEITDLQTPSPQPQPKTMADRINEKNKKIMKIRETITVMLQRNLKAIEEEGRLRELTFQEIEEKKDLERARLNKIEMEEIGKVERNYR